MLQRKKVALLWWLTAPLVLLVIFQTPVQAFPGLDLTIEWEDTIRVAGTIVDETGTPLPGATVMEKGTLNGTTADFEGAFQLDVEDDAVLSISYLGYSTFEVGVEGRSQIEITMTPDAASLEEVVVIGYGTQKRSDISGAVSQIEQEKIAQNPSPNLSNTLVGQTAGIIAVQRSGEPGEDGSQIFIRGRGTTGDATPIYVIDGIVRTARDFNQLNANEIESVSVLKDAASAAVFGVRGGNGVILITTKRGAEGRMQINLSASLGIQERTRDPEYVGSYLWAQLYNEALVNEGQAPEYTEDDLQKYQDQSSPDTHPDTDWLSVLDNTAPMQRYNISANGGSEKLQYAASLGYLDQDGIVPSNEHRRYNYRSNIDAQVTQTTRLSFDLSGRYENTNDVAAPELFRWLVSARPNLAPIKWSNGTYSNGPAYLALPENGYRNRKIQTFNGRIQIEQQLPITGLSVKGIGSYNKLFTDHKDFTYAQIPFYTRLSDGTFVEQPRGNSSLSQDHNDFQSITLEAHLNYSTTFGNSALSALLLYTQTEENWDFISGFRDGYTLAIDELNFGGAANRTNQGYSGSSGRQGVVGRLNWTIAEKIILEGSFRADGSEQFAKGNRWGFFPSGSVGYVISREPFMDNVAFLDFFKIRGSYGVLGNDRLGGSRFLYLQSYNQIGGAAVFGDGDVQPGIVEGNLANEDVTWETVKKFNIGFDATFFDYKLSLTVDYFKDNRSDILGTRNLSVPSLLGVGLPVENLSKVDNEGFEISIGHTNALGPDFSYSLNGNMTYAKNTVVFIDEPETENPNIRRTGRPLGAQYGYNALGLFQTQEEVAEAAVQIGDTAPGDVRYEDVNGDGQIDDLDRVFIGSSNTPEIIFGFNGSLQYRNFEFSFLFQGSTNVNQSYGGEAAWPFFLGTSGVLEENLDRWTPANTDASEPRVLINAATSNHAGSSFWLRDASYLRLKNLELAYRLGNDNLPGNFIQGIRLYVNANNVHTWSKIRNFDPENGDARAWGYPQLRIWNFGVDFTF